MEKKSGYLLNIINNFGNLNAIYRKVKSILTNKEINNNKVSGWLSGQQHYTYTSGKPYSAEVHAIRRNFVNFVVFFVKKIALLLFVRIDKDKVRTYTVHISTMIHYALSTLPRTIFTLC